MNLEHKFCTLGTDVTVTDGTTISGYASLFGAADQGGDTVQKGAYGASLAKGLWVKGRLLTDVAKGREAASLIAARAIDGLSIGYRTVKASKDATGGRLLAELELWEVSLVTFPMLPDARVGPKGDDPEAAAIREMAAAFEGARQVMVRD